MLLSQPQMQDVLRRAGWPDVSVSTTSGTVPLLAVMGAIGQAESSGNTNVIGTIAKGREYSVGLWQINTLVHKRYTVDQLKNPATNANEALRIYRAQGLRAWGAYTNGSYRKYLPAALAAYRGGATTTPAVPSSEAPAQYAAFTPTTDNTGLIIAAVVVLGLFFVLEL